MTDIITPIDEIVGPAKTPYQQACTQLVAFKLKLAETVAADPKLSAAPCAQVMLVFLSFLTIDKETLKPSAVYASSLTLMARGGLKSDRTARNAKKLLVRAGYLEATKSTTKDGCVKYLVRNPREQIVGDHIREMTEYLRERDAVRKKEGRRKLVLGNVPVDTTTPKNVWGGRNYVDVPVDTTDNYHRGNLRDYLYEEDAHYQRDVSQKHTSYADLDDDPHQPFPKPIDDHDAELMVDSICTGKNVTVAFRKRLRSMLNDAVLTPNMVGRMLAQLEEAA